jgi:hypothetical protein
VVSAKAGKKAIAVLVRIKTPDEKNKIGCRNVFLLTHEKEAETKFEELCADALKKGWTEKVKAPRTVDSFATIPTPAELTKVANKKK